MGKHFEAIVVGLGAMGSATLYHLAKRGVKVLGIDQFSPPHTLGSTHGESRIIREAYFEHPLYVPLLQRAYELWAILENESATQLFLQTGGLNIGTTDSIVFSGALRSAREHQLKHEILNAEHVAARFPGLKPSEAMQALLENRAGILFPEKCVSSCLQLAQKAGATILLETEVLEVNNHASAGTVLTNSGQFTADQIALSMGPWLPRLLPSLAPHLKVERQVLHWFLPAQPEKFRPVNCPIHLWEYETGKYFYGFPDLGNGVKVALHHQGQATSPETVDRQVSAKEIEAMAQLLNRYLPGAAGLHRQSVLCLYTNTADEHFLIDRHPNCPALLLLSPCSGHGFKFSSVIGEIAADLMMSGGTPFDLTPFRYRF